jgi:hypothetical protein
MARGTLSASNVAGWFPILITYSVFPFAARRTSLPDGLPALSIYFRDPDGNLLELMAADGTAAA